MPGERLVERALRRLQLAALRADPLDVGADPRLPVRQHASHLPRLRSAEAAPAQDDVGRIQGMLQLAGGERQRFGCDVLVDAAASVYGMSFGTRLWLRPKVVSSEAKWCPMRNGTPRSRSSMSATSVIVE